MNRVGILQLEAVICLAVFMGVLTLFLSALNGAGQESGAAISSASEKAEAEKCCILADSVYSLGISSFSGSVGCEVRDGMAADGEKTSACLAKGMRIVQESDKSVLELGFNGHYR